MQDLVLKTGGKTIKMLFMLSIIKRVALVATLAVTLSPCVHGAETSTAVGNQEIILHAWSWSFNTIREHLPEIKEAGYTIVQTSPINECYVGDNGGCQLFGNGKWYYHYQPTDWTIGNYQLGTRDEFKAMCTEANRLGVRVIVDVLPNHTVIDRSQINARLDSAVRGRENLFHANGLWPIKDYNDRYQCTTGEMGTLPDVNTENPDFQHYYMLYVNDVLACGARGFRYDTAKHIGLPDEPRDPKSPQNDFWDVAMGRKAVQGVRLAIPRDQLFIYGEVLQDRNVPEQGYAEYMDLTASNYGWVLRNVLNKHNAKAEDLLSWHHSVNPAHLVTWVESHDTYCNAHESASMPDELVRLGWVFLTARQYGTPLFYSRPHGSTRQNYWGDNEIGKVGNDEFKHPLVRAVNEFRRAHVNDPEHLVISDNGKQIVVERGKRAAVVINLDEQTAEVSIPVTIQDGKYRDAVTKAQVRVKKGTLTATMQPMSAYILSR